MAAKPPGGPPKAPAVPVGRAPAAPRVPVAPPTPRIPVEELARRPASTPDDEWDTDATREHDAFLTKGDVRAIAETTVGVPFAALRAGQDEVRARLGRIEERIALLERSALTPVAPPARSPAPAPVAPPPLPIVAPVTAPVAAPAPVASAAPVAIAAPSDPFAFVVAAPVARRPERISVDLSPEDTPFDGSRRRRRLAIVVVLFLLVTVGTFIGIAMTSQMRAGH